MTAHRVQAIEGTDHRPGAPILTTRREIMTILMAQATGYRPKIGTDHRLQARYAHKILE